MPGAPMVSVSYERSIVGRFSFCVRIVCEWKNQRVFRAREKPRRTAGLEDFVNNVNEVSRKASARSARRLVVHRGQNVRISVEG
jgi:hypothetical protein